MPIFVVALALAAFLNGFFSGWSLAPRLESASTQLTWRISVRAGLFRSRTVAPEVLALLGSLRKLACASR